MSKLVLDVGAMQVMALFERISGAHVKDFIPFPDQVVFVVQEGDLARAVGKGGCNVRSLERKLKKRIKVVEFSPDVVEFVGKVVFPLELAGASLDGDVLMLTAKDLKTRGLLIGRGAANLRRFESIVKRHFPVKELKVKDYGK